MRTQVHVLVCIVSAYTYVGAQLTAEDNQRVLHPAVVQLQVDHARLQARTDARLRALQAQLHGLQSCCRADVTAPTCYRDMTLGLQQTTHRAGGGVFSAMTQHGDHLYIMEYNSRPPTVHSMDTAGGSLRAFPVGGATGRGYQLRDFPPDRLALATVDPHELWSVRRDGSAPRRLTVTARHWEALYPHGDVVYGGDSANQIVRLSPGSNVSSVVARVTAVPLDLCRAGAEWAVLTLKPAVLFYSAAWRLLGEVGLAGAGRGLACSACGAVLVAAGDGRLWRVERGAGPDHVTTVRGGALSDVTVDTGSVHLLSRDGKVLNYKRGPHIP